MKGRSASAMPGPWSRTLTVPSPTSTSTTSPGGLHLAALSSRFRHRPVEPGRDAAHERRPGRELEADGVGVALGPLDGLGDEHVEADVVLLAGRLAVARELDDVADQRRHLLELAMDVLLELARGSPPAAVAGRISTSKFVRRLVSGVRSSWDASATSWRWAATDCSSAASIVLKLAASRLSSSWPDTSMRLRQVVRLGDVLGGVGQPAHRPQRLAGDERPQQRRQRDAPDRHKQEPDPQLRRARRRRRSGGGRSAPRSRRRPRPSRRAGGRP